ncbi:MAG: DUF2520 domain-containing protein [Paludibacter sp.]|nr:DUF2520 domain-containing protein [Paludibacter sp.]
MEIVFIGSGSLATHLALALKEKGVTVKQVFSRTKSNAAKLAEKLDCSYTTDLSEIYDKADIYFYALKDSAFHKTLKSFDLPDAIHVHTGGSIPMSEFDGIARKYGVFYPLQTFSKEKEVDFSQIPICIEAVDSETQRILFDLANLLNSKTFLISSEQRKKLHLAAVFACNFSNYMYDISSLILEDIGVGFEILHPLILETALKVQSVTPFKAQTGPAVRFDDKIIKNHLNMLKNRRDLKKIYKLISKDIHKRHKKI